MDTTPQSYLHWAKTHPRSAYELTVSGVTPVTLADWPPNDALLALTVTGAYGHPELLQLLADRYGVGMDNILPVAGTSTANVVALACAAQRGRAVLVESPRYDPLHRASQFLGLTVKPFDRPAAADFAPDMRQIRDGLAGGAAAVVVSDLHNPSGRLIEPHVMTELASLCAEFEASLIVDEVYRDLSHINGARPLGTAATLGDHVIATSSLTKSYGLGGLRAGWIIASPEVIRQAGEVFDNLAVDLPAPSSSLAIAALRNIAWFETRTRSLYQQTHPMFASWITKCDRIVDHGNDGAFFSYGRLPDGWNADAFCRFAVEQYDVQIVPGSFFGQPDHVRVSFGLPPDRLTEALARLDAALDTFQP